MFTLVPLIELALLIKVGEYVGVIPTIFLVASTGILGVSLARSQGYQVIKRIKTNLNQGNMPADDLIGGFLIFIGGTMLLTPGLLTDLTGFSLILPVTRNFYSRLIKTRLMKYLEKADINISSYTGFTGDNNTIKDDYIDIESEQEK